MKTHKSICLYAHFNNNLIVSDYVFTYLQSISSSGFEIIFISNSPIKPEFHSRLAIIPNCKVFERENRGNDFGAWRWAIENDLISPDTDRLLLTNDSVYGPIFSLESFFSSMKLRDDVDFWSLTDSYEGGWHLQSYFLCLSKKVFTNSSFLNVLKQDFSSLTRLEIIKKGEVQLTKSLIESGFKGEACIPYTQLEPCFEQWDAKNPTHFYWDSLIEKYNFPFIKRDLVLQNPENIQSIANLFQFIEKYSSYSIKNIKQSITEYLDSFETSNTFTEKLSVVCHLYYPGSIYYFLTKLLPLKFPQTQFIFNLSATLYYNAFFCELLKKYFPGSFILFTPNQGRDIGGKLAALDVLINSGIQSDFTLIIHDKFSPHTPTGIEWRNRLLKIISPEELSKIFRKFHQNKGAGVITTEELIKNEFDPDKDKFTCTSSAQIFSYIKRYKLNVSDYKFAAGTIFWIRTSILQKFFSVNPPLMIRKELEKGNSLDFDKGTNIHAWERLFSFIANSQGYKTIGI